MQVVSFCRLDNYIANDEHHIHSKLTRESRAIRYEFAEQGILMSLAQEVKVTTYQRIYDFEQKSKLVRNRFKIFTGKFKR